MMTFMITIVMMKKTNDDDDNDDDDNDDVNDSMVNNIMHKLYQLIPLVLSKKSPKRTSLLGRQILQKPGIE